MGNLITTLKWLGYALIASMVYTAAKKKKTLPSLAVKPHDIYTPDFYPNGHYLDLPQGQMRYWLFGNPQGKRVVLVHGISTGSVIYDKLARYLADKDYYVLVYDLWGRGYTQAPATEYDEALYTTQLALLLQKVGWDRAYVVGVSLGGAIATSFSVYYPEMVEKAVLIVPAGLMEEKTDMPIISKFLRLPFIYQYIVNQDAVRNYLLKQANKFAKSTRCAVKGLDEETEAQTIKIGTVASYQFMNHPGFIRAFTGTIVAYPLCGLYERFKALGQQETPVLVVWSDKDKTCPYYPEKVSKLLPKAKFDIYPGHGHDVLNTRFRQVHESIHNFINAP